MGAAATGRASAVEGGAAGCFAGAVALDVREGGFAAATGSAGGAGGALAGAGFATGFATAAFATTGLTACAVFLTGSAAPLPCAAAAGFAGAATFLATVA
jgi:hypothetical protein